MKLQYAFFPVGILLFFSCTNGESKYDIVEIEEGNLTVEAVDSIEIDTTEYVSEVVEKNEIKKEIETKYGKQWDLCDCVKKNDSSQKVIEKMGDEDDFDPVFARMEEIDQHCKEMLTIPNTTPEDRQKHQKRVKDCLRSK